MRVILVIWAAVMVWLLFLKNKEVNLPSRYGRSQLGYFATPEGAEWLYDAKVVAPGTNGMAFNIPASFRAEDTQYVQNGKSYQRMRFAMDGIPGKGIGEKTNEVKLTRHDPYGQYEASLRHPELPELKLAPNPMTVGQTWRVVEGPYEIFGKVVGQETVTINGEDYEKCFHLRVPLPDGGSLERWLSPEVGLVKMEIMTNKGARILMNLRQYKSGGPKLREVKLDD